LTNYEAFSHVLKGIGDYLAVDKDDGEGDDFEDEEEEDEKPIKKTKEEMDEDDY
jgi:hypothetical protein